jgi:hypothetical protein
MAAETLGWPGADPITPACRAANENRGQKRYDQRR